MARNALPKTAILNTLSQHYNIEKLVGQSLFSLNSKAVIYVRFSKDLGGGKFYFGVGVEDFNRFRSQNLYVFFVCGDTKDVLVLPADILWPLIEGAPISHGQWKLNIFQQDMEFFLRVAGAGKFNITEFRNHFGFTPKECRGEVWPKIREHIPLSKAKRFAKQEVTTEFPPTQVTLESRLRDSSRDSANPEAFEDTLAKYFTALGFKCLKIGGPGETDVFIEHPFKIIVDGKTTRAPAVSQINFTRIKQHKANHQATAILVVSVGFQPAVIRDAALEQAGLITVVTLIEILRLHNKLPVSPLNLGQILHGSGLIGNEVIHALEEDLAKANYWFERAFIIIDNIDFEWRSLDELKGRLDILCQLRMYNKFDAEELKKLLGLLSDTPFDIFQRQNGAYRCIYYPEQAKEKVLNLFAKSKTLSSISESVAL